MSNIKIKEKLRKELTSTMEGSDTSESDYDTMIGMANLHPIAFLAVLTYKLANCGIAPSIKREDQIEFFQLTQPPNAIEKGEA